MTDKEKLLETLDEILSNECPNKWVWKNEQSKTEWIKDRLVPTLIEAERILKEI